MLATSAWRRGQGGRGGPSALIEQVERRAGDETARFWLAVIEKDVSQLPVEDMSDVMLSGIAQSWIKSLRLRLRIKPSPEAIRAQTRERVRRWRMARERAVCQAGLVATRLALQRLQRR